jgi:hypothetical protein
MPKTTLDYTKSCVFDSIHTLGTKYLLKKNILTHLLDKQDNRYGVDRARIVNLWADVEFCVRTRNVYILS